MPRNGMLGVVMN